MQMHNSIKFRRSVCFDPEIYIAYADACLFLYKLQWFPKSFTAVWVWQLQWLEIEDLKISGD